MLSRPFCLVNYRSLIHIKYYLQFIVVISKFSISGGQVRSHSHGARRLRPRRTSMVAKRAGFYRRPALCHSVSGRSMWTRPARPTQCAGDCRICAGCKSSLRPSVTWSGLIGPCHVVFRLLAAWQRWYYWPRRGGSGNYVPQTGRPQVLGSNCWGLYMESVCAPAWIESQLCLRNTLRLDAQDLLGRKPC